MMPQEQPMGGATSPQVDPTQVREMLKQAVAQLKQIAADNGIDIMELLSDAPSSVPTETPMPRPPSALGQM